MQGISEDKTVGALVAERPGRSRVFEAFGIDYCCGGKKKVSEACAAKGLDAQAVLEKLQAADASAEEEQAADPAAMGLSELAAHIESTHHAYLRQELPRLAKMAGRVAKVHGDKDGRLAEVKACFDALAAELDSHTAKEEHVLFPAIGQLARATTAPRFPFGQLANPIQCMEREHDGAGDALEHLRRLTDDYTPPDWACNTYRALLDGLADLEQDLHQHIHKENNILFPRAIEIEQRLVRM